MKAIDRLQSLLAIVLGTSKPEIARCATCNEALRLTARCTGAVVWSLDYEDGVDRECGTCWAVRTGYKKGDPLPLGVTEVMYIEDDSPFVLG
jgi:hypothetical protein